MEVYTMWHCTVLLVASLDQDLLLDPVSLFYFPQLIMTQGAMILVTMCTASKNFK